MKTIRTALSLGLAVALLAAGQSAALAGSCTNTTRTMSLVGKWNPSARTTVHNETSATTLKVVIYRGSDEKSSAYIKPGEDVSKLTKFAEQGGGGKIRAEIIPTSGTMKTTSDCNYRIRYNTQDGKMKWLLPEGQSEVCAVGTDMTVACDKSFNKDKLRYRTHFRVRDPK
jgi:hypothetical protein